MKLLIPNSVQIPNFIIDNIAPHLQKIEILAILYIYRRTLGFQRYAEKISLNQFTKGLFKKDGTRLDFGTAKSKTSNIKALKNLEKMGLIFVMQTPSGNVYRPNMEPDIDQVLNNINNLSKSNNEEIKAKFNQLKLGI